MASAQYNSLDAIRHFMLPPARGIGKPADQFEDGWLLADQTSITIRAVRPNDAASLQTLVRGLSLKSRYLRLLHAMRELPPDLLAQFTHADPAQEITLLALIEQQRVEAAAAGGVEMFGIKCASQPAR